MNRAAPDDLKTICVDYQTYQTKLTKKYQNREVWEKPDPREICAYIPGSVVAVLVKEGDCVPVGASLLTFEAMKMMCTLAMPYDGVVKKIHVRPGDRVRKGKVLVEIADAHVAETHLVKEPRAGIPQQPTAEGRSSPPGVLLAT